MVVLVLVALTSGVVALSLRPSPRQQISREGERLALWLEAMRGQSRGQGRVIRVQVGRTGAQTVDARDPYARGERLNWMYADTVPVTEAMLTMGPEPVLPPQQLQLTHAGDGNVRVRVGTQGLGPWTAQ
jgi:general secretion pathway protein H